MSEITISKSEYRQLLKAELELDLLNGAGVDNWGGIDYAFDSSENGGIDFEEECDRIDREWAD